MYLVGRHNLRHDACYYMGYLIRHMSLQVCKPLLAKIFHSSQSPPSQRGHTTQWHQATKGIEHLSPTSSGHHLHPPNDMLNTMLVLRTLKFYTLIERQINLEAIEVFVPLLVLVPQM